MSPHYLLIDARGLMLTVQSVSHREKLRLSRASGLPYARFRYSTGDEAFQVQGVRQVIQAVRNRTLELQGMEISRACLQKGLDPEHFFESLDKSDNPAFFQPLLEHYGLLDAVAPVCPIMVWEGEPRYRKGIFEDYKANRTTSSIVQPAIDPDTGQLSPSIKEVAIAQTPIVQMLLQTLNLPQVFHPGAEADDTAYQLARAFLRTDPLARVTVHAEDSDWQQVLRLDVSDQDRTAWWSLRKRGTPNPDDPFDDTRLRTYLTRSTFGAHSIFRNPEMATQAKILQGDTSDNIMGAPGVGPKRALALLEQFGSWENFKNALNDPLACEEFLKSTRVAALRKLTLPEAHERYDLNASLIDLEAAPALDPQQIQVGYGHPANFSRVMHEGLVFQPCSAERADSIMQCQQDDEVAHDMRIGLLGTLDEIAFLEQSQLHFAVPYFTPESEQVVGDCPDETSISESAWLSSLHFATRLETVVDVSKKLQSALDYMAEVHAEYGIQPEPEPESEPAPATGRKVRVAP